MADGPAVDSAIDKVLIEAELRTADHLRVRSLVGFKRLAGRPQDRRDLEELEALNGTLPEDEIPGLDR